MTSVFDIILEKIHDQNTRFVFPSETTAALWARKICLYSDVRSLAQDRFLAWDRFKEETIRTKETSCKPVSSLIRRLFARTLVQQNAASPFLQAVIPAAYAESGGVFADSIAAVLSSLKYWETLHDAGRVRDDDEDRDLRIIKTKYAAFLDDHDLFEPAWEKAAFHDNKNRYIIFFPETLSDFAEYAANLDVPAVRLCSAREFSPCDKPPLRFFDSARQEIRAAVLELRRLHEAGLPYEDIALTLPDYKNTAPYVERELALHDIPFKRRSGKSLGEYPIGRLFSLCGECVSALFSFDAMKRLLLDSAIPWKEPEKNRALIDYGIKNHCVVSFRDRIRTIDAWEESFSQNPDEELSAYYKELKQNLSAMVNAGSFKKILDQYHVFRSLLDMEKCGAESDAALARCIEELSVLIEVEGNFSDLGFSASFDFFVSHLKEKNYVYVESEGGVNLYDYPVAAGAPFGGHLLLNLSQSAATIQHRPLNFLRQDKRARLGITDTDVSSAMISLYSVVPWNNYSCYTRFSASEKTFSGWAIPHSAFALNPEENSVPEKPAPAYADLFNTERQWRANYAEKPARLYAVQREGFKRWSAILESVPYKGEGADVSTLLKGRIYAKSQGFDEDPARNNFAEDQTQNGFVENDSAVLSVSATDLNEFFTCSLLWLYRRIFRLEPYREDAALLDDESRGLIYHEILRRLFRRISKTDGRFCKENLPLYKTWVKETTDSVLRSDNTLRGPLVYPLVSPLAVSMNRRLCALMETEAKHFDGLEITGLEQSYNVSGENLRLIGRIDRVSEGPMIVDYKTKSVPYISHCRWNKENGLRDFQIPMYIKLYEETSGVKVSRAFFANINEHKFVPVMGKGFSRESYQATMDSLEEAINQFKEAVLSLNFKPETISYKTCAVCKFKTMCRSLYSLNPRKDLHCARAANEEDED